ncbi:MAG: squalene synthase HpnC [Alphaproteobacteria bacterium]|nr:squalene synthase HpnC [Alphaproteobacteria bacterium]MDE2074130.1 squalene synthase HpnC [Alphaproteobacteria bacterium]
MTSASELQSGKGHRDENFPVASVLIAPKHRPAILAFYRFARAADDIADHPTATPEEKLRLLEEFRSSLAGESDAAELAVALREVQKRCGISAQHGLDLLEAFRRDVTVLRYPNWTALMDYCRYSAMPVGRFVLDVHGESQDTWPANDALCAALQVINHLQDCKKDHGALDRVYLPMDAMWAEGIGPEALMAKEASPALERVIKSLTRRTRTLLEQSRPFAGQISDARLALEVTVIQRLAEDLTEKLLRRDPLSERVHHSKLELLPLLMSATLRFFAERGRRKDGLHLAGHRP